MQEDYDPIQEYKPRRKKGTIYEGYEKFEEEDVNYLNGVDSLEELNYLSDESNDKYIFEPDENNTEYVFEQDESEYDDTTEYGKKILKKKKRRKKMLSFMKFLSNKYSQDPQYENTKINKVHFIPKLNVGKQKLGKSVAIPTVYLVELLQKKQLEKGVKEIIKYEVYDVNTKDQIMFTDDKGNLILSPEVAKVLGKNYNKLGLQKEDQCKVRDINNMLWLSSDKEALDSMNKDKANVSQIEQTIDLERERLAIALGVNIMGIESISKLDTKDPMLAELASKDGKQMQDIYIIKDRDGYKVASRTSDGKFEKLKSLDEKGSKGNGNVKSANNPNSPSKSVMILEKFQMKVGDNTLDLVLYDDGKGNIKAGVMDVNDKTNNIIEIKGKESPTLDQGVETVKKDLKDGTIDSEENREYMYGRLNQQIKRAINELIEDGSMFSELNKSEFEKVQRIAASKENADVQDIKDIIEGEIGVERTRKT